MKASTAENNQASKVRGTEIRPTDTREVYRQKIARIMLDSIVQFVGLLDAKGTVLEINKVALDAVGIKLSDVEGKPFWTTFWWQVSEEINATLRASIARAAQGEFVRWDTPIHGRAGGKETIIIDASLSPVMDDNDNVVFICAEGRDITEKKAREQEIAQKNIELRASLERVRELDEIKTQFFANVSHELRTPLQLVIGPADRLSQNDATMLPEQRRESARVIARNARMLLKHVNDLLDISKFEAGKLKLELQNADVAALVRLTASNFDVLAADRKITFLVDAQQNVASAVDPEKVQRVVMNLLSNAFKFVSDGGHVTATLRASKKDFTVLIEDSGPGVKPELRKTIFERFRQSDGGANRQFGGTGLGLAIAKEFVEMHQSTLEVLDSDLGGACFQMTFPLRCVSQSALGTAPATHHLDPAIIEGFIEELRPGATVSHGDSDKLGSHIKSVHPTVLVVEDNPEMNRFIRASLAAEYDVITAFDGQQGLEKALKSNPTLIVTDLVMPTVSGVEMITQIRKYPDLADVPILLLTAKADEELKIKLLEGGAQDFVAKPFSEKDLLVRVRNLIESKKNQERHRSLFSSMDEGFCTIEVIFDENKNPVDYRFLEINSAFERQTGLKDARGKLMRDLAPNHEQHWFDIYGQIALTGEPARFEEHAEALGRWYYVHAFRVGPPENREVAILFNDITERKPGQDAAALLGAIVDSSEDAIISKDLNGVITSWNKGAERLFGYVASEAVGQSITMLIPPDRLEEEPRILDRLKRGERVEHFETVRMRKDGSLLDISLTISPVRDSAGHIVGASKVARDITERTRIEQQRREFSRELARQVSERTAELQQANRALLQDMEERERLEEQLRQSQKLESMGVLAAGVAHDLNNLLNIIQGYASLVVPGATSEDLEESASAITETTKRGAMLVQQLLALARKTEVKMEPVDVNTVIQGLSTLIKGSFPKNIEILVNLAPAPLTIMADASQITQVLLNLCVNARDAMADGGCLALKTAIVDGKALDVYDALHAHGYVSIEITDTGMGMDKDVQNKIFEPFFTTKESCKGTGLGLAVVYGIVKSHNGFVKVKSEPMHGTTFSLYFPARSPAG